MMGSRRVARLDLTPRRPPPLGVAVCFTHTEQARG